MKALSVGLPGLENSMTTLFAYAHRSIERPAPSLPLSQSLALGTLVSERSVEALGHHLHPVAVLLMRMHALGYLDSAPTNIVIDFRFCTGATFFE